MSHPGNTPDGYGQGSEYPSPPYGSSPSPDYASPPAPVQYSVPDANQQYSVPDAGAAPSSPAYPQVPAQPVPTHDQYAAYSPGAAQVPGVGYGGPTSGAPAPGAPYPGPTSGAPVPGAAYPGSPVVPGYPATPTSGSGYDPYGAGTGGTAPMPMMPSSGAPVSGSPEFAAAGYPTSGYGQPGYPAAEAPKKSRTPLILSLVAGLLLVTTALFATLWLVKSGDYTRTVNKAHAQSVSDQSRIDDLSKQLKAANDKYDDLTQKQSGTQNQLDEITKEKQVISKCLNLLYQAIEAAANNDKNKYNSLLPQMNAACDEADKYLN